MVNKNGLAAELSPSLAIILLSSSYLLLLPNQNPSLLIISIPYPNQVYDKQKKNISEWWFMCIFRGYIPFLEDSYLPPIFSWNPLFWNETELNVRSLWTFLVNHTFYKLNVKILAASNEIRCVHCSWLPTSLWATDQCQLKHKLFWHKWKKLQEQVWGYSL